MTQEEKARAYDEALIVAKKRYVENPSDGYVGYANEVLKELFPELAESEDERIRKELVNFILYKAGHLLDEETEHKFIAWLQRSNIGLIQRAWYMEGYFDGEFKREPKWILKTGEGGPRHELNPRYGELLAEQKPDIEICPHSIKSKSYKENGYPIEDCDYGLEIALDILEKTFGYVQGYQTDDGTREHQTAIEAVKDAMKKQEMVNLEIPAGDIAPAEEDGPFDEDEFLEGELSAFLQNYDKEYDDDAAVSDAAKHFYELGKKVKQKRAEWSEVDEEMLRNVYESLYAYQCNIRAGIMDKNSRELLDDVEKEKQWLKSFRPQPKQDDLPSLSEKEIICLKRALDYLRKEQNRYGGDDFTNEIAVLEWLITHPILVSDTHWKPSEEQMKALNRCFLIGDEDMIYALKSLCDDLKKLL